ncbi:hypothetical protein KOW79_001449 [Hemibagrus wyckioides]|uniref:Uncharacterized protein n=1 Tax=Hemibagrus wyckioides TaxID=337641 RepID=A0A9D3P560_9TELE|nr:hypothetical protein KOW79_001449 [Hemibagrus wyckioides]
MSRGSTFERSPCTKKEEPTEVARLIKDNLSLQDKSARKKEGLVLLWSMRERVFIMGQLVSQGHGCTNCGTTSGARCSQTVQANGTSLACSEKV